MAITFPSSPSVNATYTASGRTWIYDGEKWAIQVVTTTATLDGLSDVTSPTPTSGDVLKHDGLGWVNGKAVLGTNTSGTYVTTVSGNNGVSTSYTTNSTTGARSYSIDLPQDLQTSGSPTFAALTIEGATTFSGPIREKVADSSISSNVMTCSYTTGTVFYQATAPSANFTINLTNAPASLGGYSITISVFVTQGATGYYPNAFQIAGSAQTIKWAGGTAPTPTSSSGKVDVFSFTCVRRDSAWTVFGNASLNY